jgi:hypothetical protein
METAQAPAPSARDADGDRLGLDWSAIATWLLAFGLVAYLGLEGGGYDPLVNSQVGIAVWWLVLAAVAVGAVPRRRPTTLAWVALGLLAAFVGWTALSLSWTESVERTWTDLARVGSYLGVFAIAFLACGRGSARRVAGAVATAIALIGLVALLARLHPAWFPEAAVTGKFLEIGRERLSYPLNYWNALAALIAIGLPLLLQAATEARHVALRALAAAAMPALMLTAFFTLSRGGIAACFVVVAIYLALASDRLPKLLTTLVVGLGGAVLVATAIDHEALRHGLDNAAAHDQGDEMLLLTIVVCLLVGLVQAGVSTALERGLRPGWTRVSRQGSLAALAVGAVVLLVALAAIDAPGRASNAWDEFKEPVVPGKGTERLGRTSGEGRYQYWSSTIREMETRPLGGTGSGTFVYWWTRDGDTGDVIRDSHSLYFQTLGELGLVGIALLLSFIATVLVGGAAAAVRAGPRRRPALAAAVAGCAAFFLTAIFDWMWQMPVLAVATLLLAAALLSDRGDAEDEDVAEPQPFGVPARIGTALLALVAIGLIAVPLASTSLVRQSQSDASSGDLAGALEAARSARNVEPAAATPRLQEALVLETQGDFAAAAVAARAATERESTNWRNWLVLARIEAERGDPDAAIRYYQRARSLNPTSSLFSD